MVYGEPYGIPYIIYGIFRKPVKITRADILKII